MTAHIYFFDTVTAAGDAAHTSIEADDHLLAGEWDTDYAAFYLIGDPDTGDISYHPNSPVPDIPIAHFAFCTGSLCELPNEPNVFHTGGEPLVICDACAEHLADTD